MSLLIRADLAAGVLRSLGDEPNGIVVMIAPDQVASWAIDGTYEPAPLKKLEVPPGVSQITVDGQPSRTGSGPNSTPIGTDELIAGCESLKEVQALIVLMGGALVYASQMVTRTLEYEFLESHVDLAKATRASAFEHGYLGR